MIQPKNFATVLLLSIVTCGIYMFYFLYVTTQDMNTMVGNDGHNTEPTTVILLSIVTCGLYSWYWYYDQGNRMKALCDRNGIPCQENGTTYLLWLLLGSLICGIGGWVAIYLFIKNFNNLAAAYNQSLGGGYQNTTY